jgi:nitrate reductase NapE component
VPFDDLSLLAKFLIAMVGPVILTSICWVVSPLLAGARRERTRRRSWVEFWLMLFAAYLVVAIAFIGAHTFRGNDNVDPSSQLTR